MNKIALSIVLMASCLSFASNDQPTAEEIQMNYAVTCGSIQDIESAMEKTLTSNEKQQALEMRDLTLDLLTNGQAAIDKRGKYSSMGCFGIVTAKDLIIKNGCIDLRTDKSIKASTDATAGLAVCQALVDSGNAMPGF